jgi:hypothetical protein
VTIDGTQLIAAAGNRVHVYDTADGDLIQALKGTASSLISNNLCILVYPYLFLSIPLLYQCVSRSVYNKDRTQRHCVLCGLC